MSLDHFFSLRGILRQNHVSPSQGNSGKGRTNVIKGLSEENIRQLSSKIAELKQQSKKCFDLIQGLQSRVKALHHAHAEPPYEDGAQIDALIAERDSLECMLATLPEMPDCQQGLPKEQLELVKDVKNSVRSATRTLTQMTALSQDLEEAARLREEEQKLGVGVLLKEACDRLDFEKIEQILTSIPIDQRYRWLTESDPSLLDYFIMKVNHSLDARRAPKLEESLKCLTLLLKNITPLEKSPLLSSASTAPLWDLCYNLFLKPRLTHHAESFADTLLEGLDIESRQKIAHAKNVQDKTVIHIAANGQILPLIRGLLEGFTEEDRMSILTMTDYKGRTPLHAAAMANGKPTTLALLEDLGPKSKEHLGTLQEEGGLTVLHFAIEYHFLDSLHVLIDAGVGTIESRDSDGNTLLQRAAEKNSRDAMDFCLQREANPDSVSTEKSALIREIIERREQVRADWAKLHITYVDGDVEEIHSSQWDERKKTVLFIFPKRDGNGAFSITRKYSNRDNITKFASEHNIKLQRVGSVEQAIATLRAIDGKMPLVVTAGHGPGEEVSHFPTQEGVTFGKKSRGGSAPVLLANNGPFMEVLVDKLEKNGVAAFFSCALGKNKGNRTVPEQLALQFEGRVVASDKNTSADGTYFSLDFPEFVRFTDKDGAGSTVTFTRESVQENQAKAKAS